MSNSSLGPFEKKEKAVLVNFARTVGSALGTVAAKTSAGTEPSRRRKAVRTVKTTAKKQVRKVGGKVKTQVAKARDQARKAARKIETSARKVRRKL
jgi:CO/xanthine dehydrogenase Mo-binding subunit